ncbi:hypothetical protein RNJ44_03799 [Nakaseomyces bracarensis]|uniref:Uncharacterized protein n=1 Tax=Nakaseomyces bracarensis TaxID=273131 RepID=A0ABR4NY17_9SACH
MELRKRKRVNYQESLRAGRKGDQSKVIGLEPVSETVQPDSSINKPVHKTSVAKNSGGKVKDSECNDTGRNSSIAKDDGMKYKGNNRKVDDIKGSAGRGSAGKDSAGKVVKKRVVRKVESRARPRTNGNGAFKLYENRCVVKQRQLERPKFNSSLYNEPPIMHGLSKTKNPDDWTNASDFIKKNLESLRSVCKFQYELYYRGLTAQQHMGPKSIESVKLPDDMVSYSRILNSMNQFASELDSIKSGLVNRPAILDKKMVPLEELQNVAKETSSSERIEKICALYDIDLTDIMVILSRQNIKCPPYQQTMLRSSDITIIHALLEREHSPYTDPTLVWPTKYKRRSPGDLMNEGLDKDDPVQKAIPLFNKF